MTSSRIIYEKLCAIRKRWKLNKAFRGAVTGLFAGFVASSFFIVINKHIPSFKLPLFLYYTIPFLFMLSLFLLEIFRRVDLSRMASMADRNAGLKERLSTALEMMERDFTTPMIKALIDDAAVMAEGIDMRQLIVFQLPARRVICMSLVLLLMTGVYFIPCGKENEITPELKELLFSQGKELENYSEKLKELAEEKDLEFMKNMAEDFEELSKKMKSGMLSKKEALSEISNLEKKWKEEKENLEKAGNFLNNEKNTDLTGDMAQKMDKKEALKDILEDCAKKTQDGKLSDEEKGELSKNIEKIKENLPEDHPLKNDMENLCKSLEKGDLKEAGKEMKELSEKMQAMAEEKELLEKALSGMKECQQEISGEGSEKEGDFAGTGEFKEGTDPFALNPTGVPVKEVKTGNEPGPADYGKGSTNAEQEGSQITNKPITDRQSEDTSDKAEKFVSIYAQERIETEQAPTNVSGKMGEGETMGSSPTKGAPTKAETAYRPYQEVYQEYKDEAEKAIEGEKIPKGYEDIVRDYFDDIDPNNLKAEEGEE